MRQEQTGQKNFRDRKPVRRVIKDLAGWGKHKATRGSQEQICQHYRSTKKQRNWMCWADGAQTEGVTEIPYRKQFSNRSFPHPMPQNWTHFKRNQCWIEKSRSDIFTIVYPHASTRERGGEGSRAIYLILHHPDGAKMKYWGRYSDLNRHLSWEAVAHNSNEHIIKKSFLFSFKLHYEDCSFLIFLQIFLITFCFVV